MGKRVALTGDEAVAYGMMQVDPDVVAAYPITPQTDIVQNFASYVADGKVSTELVTVESEHSAMSATIGAAAAGARAMTATSSQGLALMWEMLYIASSYRLPIVMPLVNRALNAPLNIHCDHSDSMGARDTCWIQIYSENVQEAYDNLIQAFKIAEHPDILLPVMVCQDGFITSHGLENLEILDDKDVKDFVGEYKPDLELLNVDKPVSIGAMDLQNVYSEHKKQQVEALKHVKGRLLEVAADYKKLTGREYGLFESYRLDDAEIATVILNSTAGTAKDVVDRLRDEGIKAGLLKVRLYRPFPAKEIAEALKGLKTLAVMDRAESFSDIGGPVFNDVKSAMYETGGPKIVNYIYGLGGRDVPEASVRQVYDEIYEIAKGAPVKSAVTHLGVRE